VVFLHGSGESGSDLEKVKAHGPPKLIAAGKEFPFIVVSPQAPDGPRRGWDIETLNAMLDDVLAKYAVEQDRVYLTGLSMGGNGSWAWATANPERFAALARSAAGGMPASPGVACEICRSGPSTGPKTPRSPSPRRASGRIAEKGGQYRGQVHGLPEAGHDSWTVTYDNPELYAWLLEQASRARPGCG
jgi:predicted peptidase